MAYNRKECNVCHIRCAAVSPLCLTIHLPEQQIDDYVNIIFCFFSPFKLQILLKILKKAENSGVNVLFTGLVIFCNQVYLSA